MLIGSFLAAKVEGVEHLVNNLNRLFQGAKMNYSSSSAIPHAHSFQSEASSLPISSLPQYGHEVQSSQICVILANHVKIHCSMASIAKLIIHHYGHSQGASS